MMPLTDFTAQFGKEFFIKANPQNIVSTWKLWSGC